MPAAVSPAGIRSGGAASAAAKVTGPLVERPEKSRMANTLSRGGFDGRAGRGRDPRRGRGVVGDGMRVHRPKRFGDDGFLEGHSGCSGFLGLVGLDDTSTAVPDENNVRTTKTAGP